MKTVTFAKRAIQGLVGTLAVVASFGAQAAPVVTLWGFEVNSGFAPTYLDSNDSPAGITGSNLNGYLGGLPSLLSWGGDAGFGKSSLGVGAATNGKLVGDIVTNAAAEDTVQVIHNNVPIDYPSLKSATLVDVIQLWALEPFVGPSFAAPALAFNIKFLETLNEAGTCVVASPIPCNDIFVMDVLGAGFGLDNSLHQYFDYGGNYYEAVVSIEGLNVLSDAACAAVGAASGCRGLVTVEGRSNEFQVSLAINAVPEPASLALFGVALAGLGMVRRRKNAA